MQDIQLYLSLAEIAGVFVGFGTLIAIRSGGAREPLDVAPMRLVVVMGMLTVIAALAPVTLGRYDLTAHQILTVSSLLVLVSYPALMLIHIRAPEYKAAKALVLATRPTTQNLLEDAAYVLIVAGSALALIVIVLGMAPALEAALYFTVVVLLLIQAAWSLLWLVLMERQPVSA